ncbi:hypothetical protein F2Q69_00004401 [Brassica cretica]|uniref:Uncharacterized protein n=1 Tax=Brassica cretica TaxID=69181 RepID=A0A8S9P0L7_BRACR|nr:hypothetical protein F2Q69_00004401 [Brassica cretica]
MVFSVTSRGTVREGLHILRYGIGQLVSRPRPAREGPTVYRQKTNSQRVGTGRDGRAQLPSLQLSLCNSRNGDEAGRLNIQMYALPLALSLTWINLRGYLQHIAYLTQHQASVKEEK